MTSNSAAARKRRAQILRDIAVIRLACFEPGCDRSVILSTDQQKAKAIRDGWTIGECPTHHRARRARQAWRTR